ncbi:MAG: hypothetical protein DI498_13840 [Paracoccus denitrificans]|nr:MAG: hypothetical protein DI498_13840 [Paracoccus denitrificans]PZO82888.1 MAG: hypothetical protein DI633_13840 [Paracoccus denitrificans]
MAKLPAIIDLIAKHDTRSVPTITNYARVLREAGYLPKGKRGRGAPDLHPLEVANLVIGLAGASDAVDAPHAVEVLKSAKLNPNLHLDGGNLALAKDELPHWSFHEQTESFGSFLASLLLEEPRRDDCPDDMVGVTNMSVTINEVARDAIFGSVEAYLDDGNQGFTIGFQSHHREDVERALEEHGPEAFAGRSWGRSTWIGYNFFVDMSELLLGGLDDDSS